MLPDTSVASTSFRSTASVAEAGEQQLKQKAIEPATEAKVFMSNRGTIFMDCIMPRRAQHYQWTSARLRRNPAKTKRPGGASASRAGMMYYPRQLQTGEGLMRHVISASLFALA